MSAVGLATVSVIESPQQLAARSAAPAATLITAPARWQVLRSAITAAGAVRSARRIVVTASAPFTIVTVTRLPVRLGDRVRPGQLLAEIDGRPILLLRGRLPAYRDLHEGDKGTDVTQLQRALESLGYADYDPPGVFGQSTALALLLFYRHLGYEAPIFRRPASSSPKISAPPAQPGGTTIASRQTASGLEIPSAYLPMSEAVFIPSRSALVTSVGARVGGQPGTAPLLTLATGRPYVTAGLTAHQAAQVRAGLPAVITAASPARTAAGTVTRVGRRPTTTGHYRVLVRSRRTLPQRLVGAGVRLTIEAPVTAGPVLTVPVAAIVTAVHGRPAHVVVVTAARRRVVVPIITGPVADGLVAVQPVHTGGLRPGDRVLIGSGR
jgi:peptidoglycan hydrolase-like protein with peptidoglycan-binding domain